MTAAIRRDDDGGSAIDKDEIRRLRGYNVIVGLIHLAQGIAMVALSTDFTLPVTRGFLTGPPGTDPAQEAWFDVPLGPAVAAFLFLAALDHLLMATPGVSRWYTGMLTNERNDARWIEYSVSASLMIVLIAMISGVSDIAALVAIGGVNACMIFFGLVHERINRASAGRADWMAYIFGCFAGAVPWAIVALQLASSEARAPEGGPPTFVYGIVVSLFLLFNTFAVNMVLQYRRVGPWRSYLFGERAYILLSLIAKSALAWQVFANVLVG
ncbi:MAG: Heliorhodopsin [uncultured Thermomicrobiales bacterium]|uniref:Heliorhodopsin n=1 Tax=uncultured Thermomicrobiales bacterium TaxID=1645740 RepID=A0A6J4VUH8_9BACT|nr:MAG: Heliorhodopsin [uncultured Thermomicrobiales bacterium]